MNPNAREWRPPPSQQASAPGAATPGAGTSASTPTSTPTTSRGGRGRGRGRGSRGGASRDGARGGGRPQARERGQGPERGDAEATADPTATGRRGGRGGGRGGRGGGRGRGRGRGGCSLAGVPATSLGVPASGPDGAAAPTKNPKPRPKDKGQRKEKPKGDRAAGPSPTELTLTLAKRLASNKYDCMVCYEIVRRGAAVWSCRQCYAIFHVHCIKQWARKSNGELRCPGCNGTDARPIKYHCFCGKVSDPPNDPYLTPHSCGDVCGRERPGGLCPHPCTLPCHPGPCPPCEAIGAPQRCFCGRTTYQLRCGEVDEGHPCDSVCGRTLECGVHTCTRTCHPGPCGDCPETVELVCHCGASHKEFPCGTTQFSCGGVCDRTLGCSNHKCTRQCHAGACPPCPMDPTVVTSCGCAAPRPISELRERLGLAPHRTSCLDPVPSCGRPCRRRLPCGCKCGATCHPNEPCPPCPETQKTKCRCGAETQEVACVDLYDAAGNRRADAAVCNRICRAKRNCKRHQCGIRCCPTGFANPTDPDGMHICRLTCGKALRCGHHTCPALCHPGHCEPCPQIWEEISCACGATVLFPPLPCGTRPPVCRQVCAIERPCGHPANHTCHSEGECPPCTVMVSQECVGGHGYRKRVQCSQAHRVTCSAPCGKQLPCGISGHVCRRDCHVGPCEADEASRHACGRLLDCGHACRQPCHGTDPCSRPCDVPVRSSCPCGLRTQMTPCATSKRAPLMCEQRCEIEKRNRLLSDALGVPAERAPSVPYNEILLDAVDENPEFVRRIEATFASLVNGSQRTFNFPPMNRHLRTIVHHLSDHYGLHSESLDPEPNRNVRISKQFDSRIPAQLLSRFHGMPKHLRPSAQQALQQERDQAPKPLRPAIDGGTGQAPSPKPLANLPMLLLYGLSTRDREASLHEFLGPFAGCYVLKRIDDSQAIAHFKTEEQRDLAAAVLEEGRYKTRPFSSEELYSDLSTAPVRPAAQLSSPPPVTENAFGALDEDEWGDGDPDSDDVGGDVEDLGGTEGTDEGEVPEEWDD